MKTIHLNNLTVPDQGVFDGKQLTLVFLDFETFMDKKAGYHMGNKGLSLTEYVRDERFKVHGLCLSHGLENNIWWAGSEPQIKHNLENLKGDLFAVIGHNLKFDAAVLAWKFNITPALYIDTLAMSRSVLGSAVASHSLASLAEYYGLPSKGEMKTDGIRDLSAADEAALAEYCKHDVWLCREIYKRLAVNFPASQYAPMSWTIKAFVEPKLQINVPLVEKAATEEIKRREKVFEELQIPKETFASGPKFKVLMALEGFAVPTKKSPRTGLEIPALSKTDEGFLALLTSSNPRLRALADARLVAKSTILETRAGKFGKVGKTGPWPFDINFSGAQQTHRYSGGNGAGGNPQNLPRGSVLRGCIEAPAGFALVVGDFAAIEARIVAYLAREKRLTDVYEAGGDVYCDFASKFFGRKITKADKQERWFAKTAILGLGYGMGNVKFAKTASLQTGRTVGEDEARKAVDFYRIYYSQVPALWRNLDRMLELMVNGSSVYPLSPVKEVYVSHEHVTLPSGLELKYPGLKIVDDEYVYRGFRAKKKTEEDFKIYGGKLLENISQALAGELTKLAITRIEEAGYTVAGQCHDEIIVVCASDEAAEAANVVREAMTESPSWWTEIRLDAEIGIGKSWLEAKP